MSTNRRHGFTLVEVLVSIAIVSVMLIALMTMVAQISNTWLFATNRASQFTEARNGFESITRRLSQATLNTYMDYVSVSGNNVTYRSSLSAANTASFVPNSYARASELRFISGPNLAGSNSSTPVRPSHAVFFQAPLGFASDQTDFGGLSNLLNTWGYYIEFNSDIANAPTFVSSLSTFVPRYRFRLVEMMEPSESLSVYKYTNGNVGLTSSQPSGMNWFTDPLNAGSYSRVLAENIVALVITPKLSPQDQIAAAPGGTGGDGLLAPNYSYDSTSTGQAQSAPNATVAGILNSRNQLPPLIQVTMVAVDETSYKRFQGTSTTAPDLGLGTLFQTVGDTTNPSNPGYAQDLQTLENTLQAQKLNYRVFSTTISVKSAKWSSSQTN